MNELTLKKLFGEVLQEAASGSSIATVERAFEERLPAMLVSRDPAADISLPNSAIETIVKRVLVARADPDFNRSQITDAARHTAPSMGWTLAAGVAAAIIIGLALWLASIPKESSLIATPDKPSVQDAKPNPVAPSLPDRPLRGPVAQENSLAPPGSGRLEGEKPPRDEPRVNSVLALAGRFGEIDGNALVQAPGGAEQVAALGMPILIGSRIRTGDADVARIDLADGSSVSLGFGTTIVVSKASPLDLLAAPLRNIELLEGSIYAKVAHTPDARRFTVHTPLATAEALSTEFIVALENRGQRAVLQVKTGQVAFHNDLDRVVVSSMMESTAVAGAKPTEPKRIEVLDDQIFATAEGHTHFRQTTERLDERGALTRLEYPMGWSGLSLLTIESGNVVVASVYEYSPAQEADLKKGNIIITLKGIRVGDHLAVLREIARSPGRELELRVRRGETTLNVAITPVAGGSLSSRFPRALARLLHGATWPAFSGDFEASLRALQTLAADYPHAAVYNNLAVIYEMKDDMGPAIRNYRKATELDPDVALYHSNLGSALKKIGNFQRSVEEARLAHNLNPRSVNYIAELVQGYTLLERFADAHAVLDAAITGNPNDVHLWIYRGTVFFDSGRLARAREAYFRATELDPGNYNAWWQLAYTYKLEGNLERAEKAFDRVLEIKPNDADAFQELGSVYRRQERFVHAVAAYEKALEINPRSAGAHDGLAWVYEHMERPNDAEAHYRRAIELDPRYFSAIHNLAILMSSRDTKEAEELFARAIELAPGHMTTYRAFAEMLADNNRDREAIANFKKAIELGPHDTYSYTVLGEFYRKRGRLAESVAVYRAAVKANPENAYLHLSLGWNLTLSHRWQESITAYRKCVALEPSGTNTLHALVGLANALIFTGDLVGAEKAIDRALKMNPEDTWTQSTRAYFLARKGILLDEALELAGKCTQRPDTDAYSWLALGYVHLKRGEFDQAIEPLKRAVEEYGKAYLAADALVILGQVYEAKKDVGAARDAYRRALVIEPDNKAASKALKRLGG